MTSVKIKEKSWKIINSKKFLIFVITMLTLVFVYNLIAYSIFDYYYISSIWFKNNKLTIDSSYYLLGYLSIVVSYVASTTGTIGTILIVQRKGNFKWYWFIGLFSAIIECIITGLFYTLMASIIMFFIIITHYKAWNSELSEHSENVEHIQKSNKKVIIISTIIFLFYLIGFTLINYFFVASYIDYGIEYLDIYASGVAIFSMFLLMRNNKNGFLLYGINDFMYFALFIFVGLYAMAFSYIVYLMLDIFSYSVYE